MRLSSGHAETCGELVRVQCALWMARWCSCFVLALFLLPSPPPLAGAPSNLRPQQQRGLPFP